MLAEINGAEAEADVDPAADVDTGAEAWPEAQASMEADIDPDALTVMAKADADLAAIDDSTFDENLARAQADTKMLAEKRAPDHAKRDRAAVDEPVMQAELFSCASWRAKSARAWPALYPAL